jgi:hypothetical protein
MKMRQFIMMSIPVESYEKVCATLAGVSLGAIVSGDTKINLPNAGNAASASTQRSEPVTVETPTTASPSPTPTSSLDSSGTSPAEAESDPALVDAHGWPWSADLHASTKGTTKDGLWRMKVGVTRPDPKPGFPKTDATPSSTSTASPATPVAATVTEPAGSSQTEEPASAAASQEDDEFAMFAAAAAKVKETETAAAASVPARVWTDADLGTLCNQAAMKLGDPTPIKEVIAGFMPEGEVAHSRNVPAERREEFAKAIEAKAGIEFAG